MAFGYNPSCLFVQMVCEMVCEIFFEINQPRFRKIVFHIVLQIINKTSTTKVSKEITHAVSEAVVS